MYSPSLYKECTTKAGLIKAISINTLILGEGFVIYGNTRSLNLLRLAHSGVVGLGEKFRFPYSQSPWRMK